MNKQLLTICDEQSNHELKLEYPELPEAIRQVVEETISANNSRCLNPDKSKGRCLQMSHELMYNLAVIGKTPFVDCKLIFRPHPHPHFWLYVDGWHIDLTARQFNPHEQCPKIWKHEGFNLNGLYYVEKGKGLVLFKLTPFIKTSTIAYMAKEMLHSFISKNRTLAQLITKRVNEAFGGVYRGVSSFSK